jgi:hypothetical protein
MTDAIDREPGAEPTAAELTTLAAAAGVTLEPDHAARLAPQAAAHFAMLRQLDDVADPTVEPAATFRLPALEGADHA